MYFHCWGEKMHAKPNNMKNMDEFSLWNKKIHFQGKNHGKYG
jgi:hypothetical protein